MDISTKNSYNKICPVCSTPAKKNAVYCKKCAWQYSLQNTPQYLLELNRAKHLNHMVVSFEKLYEQINARCKIMEQFKLNLAIVERNLESKKAKCK